MAALKIEVDNKECLRGTVYFHTLLRQLYKEIGLTRVSDDDYETGEKLLLDVFNAGRIRGHYENKG